MKRRFLGRTCLTVLLVGVLICVAAFFILSIMFTQSQAGEPTGPAPTTQVVTSTQVVMSTQVVTSTQRPRATPLPASVGVTEAAPQMMVTVEYAASPTPLPLPVTPADATDLVGAGSPSAPPSPVTPAAATEAGATGSPTGLPVVVVTATPGSVGLGTVSYPLTVTVEVQLALTHVARYENSVEATRTAVEAESQTIYATLTARAPTKVTP